MIDPIRQILQRATVLVNSRTLGVAAAFAAKVTGAGLGFLFSIMLARLLGPAGTGVYFLALTILSIGATIARLGLDNAVLRFAAVTHDQGDRTTLAALYRQGMGLVVVAGVTVALFIWMVAPHLPLGGDRSVELQAVLPVMLPALIPTALILLQGEFFKATGSPGMATFVQAVVLPMFLVMGTSILFWQGDATMHNIAFVYVAAATASVLLAGAAWSRRKPGLWQEQGHFDTRLLLRTSLPLLWVASMGLIMGWTDILVLGVWTDAATVGVYGVATRIAALTAFILVAVNSVTAPRFAALYAQGNHKALERLAQQSAGWMLLTASPIILFLLLFPEWILQLFGADFVEGASLLRILALGQLVNVAMGSVGYLLMMTGYERLMRNTIMLSALLNFLGNLVLVPIYGGMGAAVSTALSLAFMNLLSYLLVNKKLGINTMGYLFRGDYSCGSR
jgi:O-antigen/teichoic acid export membrane protein